MRYYASAGQVRVMNAGRPCRIYGAPTITLLDALGHSMHVHYVPPSELHPGGAVSDQSVHEAEPLLTKGQIAQSDIFWNGPYCGRVRLAGFIIGLTDQSVIPESSTSRFPASTLRYRPPPCKSAGTQAIVSAVWYRFCSSRSGCPPPLGTMPQRPASRRSSIFRQ